MNESWAEEKPGLFTTAMRTASLCIRSATAAAIPARASCPPWIGSPGAAGPNPLWTSNTPNRVGQASEDCPFRQPTPVVMAHPPWSSGTRFEIDPESETSLAGRAGPPPCRPAGGGAALADEGGALDASGLRQLMTDLNRVDAPGFLEAGDSLVAMERAASLRVLGPDGSVMGVLTLGAGKENAGYGSRATRSSTDCRRSGWTACSRSARNSLRRKRAETNDGRIPPESNTCPTKTPLRA